MLKLSERGIIQLIIPLILLAGIGVGVYLITSGNPLKLFSKASNPPIVFQKADGSTLPVNAQGIPQSTANGFKVLLTSTLGPPATTSYSTPSYSYPTPYSTPSYGTPSYSTPYNTPSNVQGVETTSSYSTPAGGGPVSGPISTGTVSFKVAETPTDLTNEVYIPYTTEPMIVGFTFKDQNPGVKFLWVEFLDNTGDVTTDGKITPMDTYEVSRIVEDYKDSLYTKKPYTDDQKKRADVNGDTKVSSIDALFIRRYVMGIDKTFKACTPSPT